MPEVHPLYPNHHSYFQRWAQLASFALNPWFAKERWSDVYRFDYALANNQGFGMDNDPRANFVMGQYLNQELPKVEALLTGGSLVEGEPMGEWTKIKGLHFNTPISLEYIQDNPQFWVRGVYAGGTGQPFRMLGDKYTGPAFIHPLIVNNDKGDLVIESYKLQEWTDPNPPDPLKIYLTK
jgi:hypothetical protein